MSSPQIHYIPGGADIDPEIYNEPRHPKLGQTNINFDRLQLNELNIAIRDKRPIIGICRGMQLLCVQQGGKLIQHIDYQGGEKPITDLDTQEQFLIPKAHHQVCVPDPVKSQFHVLAYSYVGKQFIPEVIYYPNIKAIGIQGHPEWLKHNIDAGNHTETYLRRIVKRYLDIDITSWRKY
jgi:gamma-glutamyl-gamma-aminobutyrate hydrolase PuuD